MVIVTAIELCGSFITGNTGQGNTRENFLAFWKSKYLPKKYHEIGDLLYKIFRNGVSHSFVAKGGVIPSGEEKSSDKHLGFFKQGVFVYVPKLEEDVVAGILMLLKDMKEDGNNLQKNYSFVLSELKRVGEDEYEEFVKEKRIQIRNEIISGDIHPDFQHITIAKPPDIITGSTVGSTIVIKIEPSD
ncbi:hypothetical protein C4571_01715 [Candidatus Parcubacteria bacterium]|nr:MAG: hypothetical protein C4571_01715 [Candidatus Parcubacteria bacterium]